MGRRSSPSHHAPPTDWESERTLAAAEADAAEQDVTDFDGGATACACGHRELLLEGYWRVVDGKLDAEPLEVESLTCPECGREYEAVQIEGGRITRGDLLGQTEVED